MEREGIDNRNHKQWIIDTIQAFFQAVDVNNRKEVFSFFSTDFQRNIPLNYFLLHSKYDIDLGRLIEIKDVQIKKEENRAWTDVTVVKNGKEVSVELHLKMDFGGWKIEGEDLFRG